MASAGTTRMAVLIDADNASASVARELLEEVAKYGTATVKRAYGDWTTQNLVGWKEQLHRRAIQPMQQFAYTKGKNSTDSALPTTPGSSRVTASTMTSTADSPPAST